jgi:hypothetical protein
MEACPRLRGTGKNDGCGEGEGDVTTHSLKGWDTFRAA